MNKDISEGAVKNEGVDEFFLPERIEVEENKGGSKLHLLKENEAWIELEKIILSRIQELSDVDLEKKDLSFEELGHYYLINKSVRSQLQSIINIVDAHYDYEESKKRKEESSDE